MNNCECGGLIMERGKVYSYAGKVCHCDIPSPVKNQAGLGSLGALTNCKHEPSPLGQQGVFFAFLDVCENCGVRIKAEKWVGA